MAVFAHRLLASALLALLLSAASAADTKSTSLLLARSVACSCRVLHFPCAPATRVHSGCGVRTRCLDLSARGRCVRDSCWESLRSCGRGRCRFTHLGWVTGGLCSIWVSWVVGIAAVLRARQCCKFLFLVLDLASLYR